MRAIKNKETGGSKNFLLKFSKQVILTIELNLFNKNLIFISCKWEIWIDQFFQKINYFFIIHLQPDGLTDGPKV